MPAIPRTVVTKGMTYDAYTSLIETLLAEGKTTGPNQSEGRTNFTRLNLQRMNRIQKQTVLSPELEAAAAEAGPQLWLVLTEAWCGDAANSIPVMDAIAQKFPNIALRMILRDEHPDIMDRYLTEGSRSIPIVIVLDPETLVEKAVWGPRPEPAQQLMREHQANPVPGRDIYRELQLWYNGDKGATLQSEFVELLKSA